jgi:hypothetical protein
MLCLVIEKIIPVSISDFERVHSFQIDRLCLKMIGKENNVLFSLDITNFCPSLKSEAFENETQLAYIDMCFNSIMVNVQPQFEHFMREICMLSQANSNFEKKEDIHSPLESNTSPPKKSYFASITTSSIVFDVNIPCYGAFFVRMEGAQFLSDSYIEGLKEVNVKFLQYDKIDFRLLYYSNSELSKTALLSNNFYKATFYLFDKANDKRMLSIDCKSVAIEVQYIFFQNFEHVRALSEDLFQIFSNTFDSINKARESTYQELGIDFMSTNLEGIRFAIAPTSGLCFVYELGKFFGSISYKNLRWFEWNFYLGKCRDGLDHRLLFEADSKDELSFNQRPLVFQSENRDFLLPQNLPSVYGVIQKNVKGSEIRKSRRLSLVKAEMEAGSLALALEGTFAFSKMSNALNENVLNRLLHLQNLLNSHFFEIFNALSPFFTHVQSSYVNENKKEQEDPVTFVVKLLFQGIDFKISSSLQKKIFECTVSMDKFYVGIKRSPQIQRSESKLKLVKSIENISSDYLVSSHANFDRISVSMNCQNFQEKNICLLHFNSKISLNLDVLGKSFVEASIHSALANLDDVSVALNPEVLPFLIQLKVQYLSILNEMKQRYSELMQNSSRMQLSRSTLNMPQKVCFDCMQSS